MNTPFSRLPKDLQQKVRRIVKEVNRDLPIVIGKIAVDHFRGNIRKGGFVNRGLHKWKDVKRRDPNSPWYGFEYKGEKRTSLRFTRDRKTGKTKRSKKQRTLNYSHAATTRQPLTSKRMGLHNSLGYKTSPGKVTVVSDRPYAEVQNSGGTIKVFGKHPVKLEGRQFAGESHELNVDVGKEITEHMDGIFK